MTQQHTSADDGELVDLAPARVPDFFIVGHAKSGTTALFEMLRAHPQIFMPALKETRFFSRELHPGLARSQAHPTTLEDYLALFAPAGPGQRAGEASPSYLRSRTAAARIAELQPDARIIAIFREPVSFLRSLHLQLLESHVENEKDFGAALEREPERRRERERSGTPLEQSLLYSEHVRYTEQLRRFHAVFAPEQVLVLIYDDFRADNAGTVRRVLRLPRRRGVRRDRRRRGQPDRAGALARRLRPVPLAVSRRRRARRRGQDGDQADDAARAAARRHGGGSPAHPHRPAGRRGAQLALELRRRYSGEVAAFGEYLGRDLRALWGYDQLG